MFLNYICLVNNKVHCVHSTLSWPSSLSELSEKPATLFSCVHLGRSQGGGGGGGAGGVL